MIIGADTRLTQGYEILSRNVCRLHELTSKCILGMGGCLRSILLNRFVSLSVQKLEDIQLEGVDPSNRYNCQ